MEPFEIEIKNLRFSYALADSPALDGINLAIREGEYVALCGESGCGKTTLLRHLKSALTPHGTREGKILYRAQPLEQVDARTQCAEIGYVQQDPENAVVTDRVYHELAFGPESLGMDIAQMRLRVAEMASYFGIGTWFDRKTDSLSGGQLQLLQLAAVMALHPRVLLLDEPTSQLDPVAAADFLATIDRIHRELGMTIVLTEHRLEDVLPAADRVVVLHHGKVAADSAPREIGRALSGELSFLRDSMPSAMRIYAGTDSALPCPLTVREGKQWLQQSCPAPKVTTLPRESRTWDSTPAVRLRDVFFTYEKQQPDVLRGLSLEVPQGAVFALLGGNGAGKSTAMQVCAGLLRPYRGSVELFGRNARRGKNLYAGTVGVLPQQVRTLFTEKTVARELEAAGKDRAAQTAALLQLEHLLVKHPYDLSGGEQQRLALGKVLLHDPQILFLDEPTKGMDSAFKSRFAALLHRLTDAGKTVFMVSHDVEFCARHADLCAMLFDGMLAACAETNRFFSDLTFYTTAANRIARSLFAQAITDEDVIRLWHANKS